MKQRFLLGLLCGAIVAGLDVPAIAAPSAELPNYTVGPQPDGSVVMSTNQRITPAGKLVNLGSPLRAKAIAVDPSPGRHAGAVLLMGASAPVQVFDTRTGKVLQSFLPAQDSSGSYGGIAYSADGRYLFFSQDSSYLTAAKVGSDGLLSEFKRVSLPPDTSIKLYSPGTAYPGGVASSADGRMAYVLLNQNNTLGVIDMTTPTPTLVKQIRVGNVPNSIVVSHGLAYVSNEGGRVANAADFTDLSAGTPIVTDPSTDSASTGTVSVVDLRTGRVIDTIDVGLHPTGMTISGSMLFVANAYSDSVSVIDLRINRVIRTIDLGIPFYHTFGTMPTSLVVDRNLLFVTLYTANAVAVVDLTSRQPLPLIGYIPTASTPSTIAFSADGELVVSDDKGIGTQGSLGSAEGLTGLTTKQDTGTVSIIKVPDIPHLLADTVEVVENNHWDLLQNTLIGPQYVDPNARPVAIPAHIGEPSLIKHVFLIIKENRTYDQMLGDVAKGNGDPSLAMFGAAVPNQHALIDRFPLLDNVYAPARQSADGHPWIVSSISPYSVEIEAGDFVRSYPGGNQDDEMAHTPRGFLWQAAAAKGLTVKMYGEWSRKQTINGTYSWSDWYNYSQILEGKRSGTSPITADTDTESSPIPSVIPILDPHYPSNNTGIPDQYRADYWLPIFANQEATDTLPNLTIMWLPDDHTSGYTTGFPVPAAQQADNDLALGRIVEAITHGKDWPTSAIFVEEDDSQDGVDHVDGHRQPVYIISPYARQYSPTADGTTYDAESINRTIEQILGMSPLTQFDLVASPMSTAFTNTPNLAPFDHVEPTMRLDTFPTSSASNTLRGAWNLASNKLMKGHTNHADSVDERVLNHIIWYASTNFRRPYPGEKTVLWPTAFHPVAPSADDDD